MPPLDPLRSSDAGPQPLDPEQWAEVVNSCPDAVLVIDVNHRIRGWNRTAETIFGYTEAEALGQRFDLLIPADRKDSGELEKLTLWNEEGGAVHEFLTEREHKDGRRLKVSLTRTVLRGQQGEVLGAVAILRDITESERTRRSAVDALHLARLGEMAAQIAHEMRNPLAGIHGAVQILRRRDERAEAQHQEVYDAVANEIHRLDRLVSDLQRFARPVAGVSALFRLDNWLDTQVHRLQTQHPRLRMSWVEREEISLAADPLRLEEVLDAIVQNSCDAVAGSVCIKLRLQRDPNGCRLVIEDRGPGIPRELHDRIFEPFYTSKPRGSGLGLALARRNLESMGGELRLQTDSKHACFELQLPLA